MKKQYIKYLRCPVTGQKLKLENSVIVKSEIKSGNLVTPDKKQSWKIVDFIPRFVPESNYANSFGWQWNKFSETQLDSYCGVTVSKDRFFKATGWTSKEMKGKMILDAGCGAGRFAEVAAKTDCLLFAIDYSSAIDAARKNLGDNRNIIFLQADIYHLPFADEFFDGIYSLGVLQHTPDVKMSFFSLLTKLKKKGKLVTDYYEKTFKAYLLPKFWIRPITKRMNKIFLFNLLEKTVPFMFYCSVLLSKTPLVGNLLKRLVPVANYKGILPLNDDQLKEWALLDTFDWLSPTYDNPQSFNSVTQWLKEADLKHPEVLRVSHLVARGIK